MSHGYPTILIVGKTNVSSFILCGRTIFFVTFTVFFWRAIANLTPFFGVSLVEWSVQFKVGRHILHPFTTFPFVKS